MTPELETTIRQWCSESEGWTSADRCVEMAQLILTSHPHCVVELGVFGGRSFIPQALALKDNGHGQIYGVDAWKKDATIEGYDPTNPEDKANRDWWLAVDIHDIHKKAVEAVWKYQVDEYAVLICSASQNAKELFYHECIDILFIDGCHSEIASCRDAELYLPRVVQNGFIWLDDCDWASTKKMQSMVEAECDLLKDCGSYKLFRKR